MAPLTRTALLTRIGGVPEHLTAREMVHRTMRTIVADRAKEGSLNEDSFFVGDLGSVARQVRTWRQQLPNVQPHYAVKCNDEPQVLQLLASLDVSFDCASKHEIIKALPLVGNPGRIVYANTVKHPSYVKYAAEVGVKRMTFDSVDELFKIKEHHPDAELLMRIVTDDSQSLCQLSCKFGAAKDMWPDLLRTSQEIGLKVVGVAFHVGSGCSNEESYGHAIRDARQAFHEAAKYGHEMDVLDIGGGFEDETFVSTAKYIREALTKYGFDDGSVELIAEPGRLFVAKAFTLATCVLGRRLTKSDASEGMLYVSDGVYGNLNLIIFDHQVVTPKLLESNHTSASTPGMTASVWGPTCDGLDRINHLAEFPRSVEIGDWLYFENVGAYSLSASTSFNGFNRGCQVHYVYSGH